jgi:hypothetical protein
LRKPEGREKYLEKWQDTKGENMVVERMQGVIRSKASYENGMRSRETGM